MTSKGSPTFTTSPFLTNNFSTQPGIGLKALHGSTSKLSFVRLDRNFIDGEENCHSRSY